MRHVRTVVLDLIGCAACVCVIFVANTAQCFGRAINLIWPCQPFSPAVSMTCYQVYDIYVMAAAALIGVAFLGHALYTFLARR